MASNPTAPSYPTIPVPESSTESLLRTCNALKKAVEMLTGGDSKSRDGTSSDRFAAHVFISPTGPEALHPGDLWLCTNQNYTFNIWDGASWLLVAELPPQGVTIIEGVQQFRLPRRAR